MPVSSQNLSTNASVRPGAAINSAYTAPDITSVPSLNALSNAARAARWRVSSASQSATRTFVSIAVVIPRHIPVVHASTSVPPSCPFRFLDCRFPCTSQRDSLSAPPSRAYPFHLPQIAIGLRPAPRAGGFLPAVLQSDTSPPPHLLLFQFPNDKKSVPEYSIPWVIL